MAKKSKCAAARATVAKCSKRSTKAPKRSRAKAAVGGFCPPSWNYIRTHKANGRCYVLRKDGTKKFIPPQTRAAWEKTLSGRYAASRVRDGETPWIRETGRI